MLKRVIYVHQKFVKAFCYDFIKVFSRQQKTISYFANWNTAINTHAVTYKKNVHRGKFLNLFRRKLNSRYYSFSMQHFLDPFSFISLNKFSADFMSQRSIELNSTNYLQTIQYAPLRPLFSCIYEYLFTFN